MELLFGFNNATAFDVSHARDAGVDWTRLLREWDECVCVYTAVEIDLLLHRLLGRFS
jgi:hypothetical protein